MHTHLSGHRQQCRGESAPCDGSQLPLAGPRQHTLPSQRRRAVHGDDTSPGRDGQNGPVPYGDGGRGAGGSGRHIHTGRLRNMQPLQSHTHTHTPRAHVPNIMVPSGRIVWSPSRGGAMPGAAPAPPWHSTHVTPCNSGHSLAVPAAAHSGPRSLHHLRRSWPRTENRSRPAGAAAGSAAEAAAAGSAAEAARAALVGGEAVLEVSARF